MQSQRSELDYLFDFLDRNLTEVAADEGFDVAAVAGDAAKARRLVKEASDGANSEAYSEFLLFAAKQVPK